MEIVLFDHPTIRKGLMPLTLTRPVADLRIGILKISEKWEKYFGQPPALLTENYLQAIYPLPESLDRIYVNAGLCPDSHLLEVLFKLKNGEVLCKGDIVLARKIQTNEFVSIEEICTVSDCKIIPCKQDVVLLEHHWHIFQQNGKQIRLDFDLMKSRFKTPIITDKYTRVYAPYGIFIDENVQIKSAILNAENGPIYIGKEAEIQEGAMIRGPFSLGEHSVVQMGAKIRGDVTVGPYCKVGGEISNSILHSYSNKSHDGFLGNSVIGAWCNLGADTNTSNLKNNYSTVKVWSYICNGYLDTQLMFCGLVMGDHSKCGINTMFNTGTVVGVSANVFGGGFPDKYIPDFSWGPNDVFRLDKALEVAERVMQRRNIQISAFDKSVLEYLYNLRINSVQHAAKS